MEFSKVNTQANAFKIYDENDLLKCFREKDRKQVLLPKKMQYPRYVQHYFSWIEPSGTYAYLIFCKPGWERPYGMILRRGGYVAPPSGSMCNWCHAYGSQAEISHMTVKVNSNLSVAVLACNDLSCLHKLETVSNVSGKDLDLLTQKLCERMGLFFENTILKPQE